MEARINQTKEPVYIFAGYHCGYLPGQGRIIPAQLLSDQYKISQPDIVRLRLAGSRMSPAIPADALVNARIVHPADPDSFMNAVLVALVAEPQTGRIAQVHYGRLKAVTGKRILTLHADNAVYSPVTLVIAEITLLFRVEGYHTWEPVS